MIVQRAAGSFRDPAGHVVIHEQQIHRVVMPAGRESYEQLMASGLYERLTARGLLVPHEDIGHPPWLEPGAWRALKPARVPLITYPYEWSFSALKDAARLTLTLQHEALRHGMSLKDASAFNVQFEGCRPVFIDTLSFEPVRPGPWRAYRQFCQHFLVPLALMSYRDVRLGQLFSLYPDGVPLDLASRLLPARTWGRLGLLMHLHLHAWAETHVSRPRSASNGTRASSGSLTALVESLDRAVESLSWNPGGGWTKYEQEPPSYSEQALQDKTATVDAWLGRLSPAVVWDLGANTGRFSRLAAGHGAFVAALEQDAGCVEALYRRGRKEGSSRVLPLVVDLAAPSPALGWAHEERSALAERGPADVLLALAVLHHLAIGRGLPFDELARYFARLGRALIIEFAPSSDPLVEPLLIGMEERAEEYTPEQFEAGFGKFFRIEQSASIADSTRRLYLMIRR